MLLSPQLPTLFLVLRLSMLASVATTSCRLKAQRQIASSSARRNCRSVVVQKRNVSFNLLFSEGRSMSLYNPKRWLAASAIPLLSLTMVLTPRPAMCLSQKPFAANRSFASKPGGNLDPESPDKAGPLNNVAEALDNSWVRQLSQETEMNLLKSQSYASLSPKLDDNRTKRPVYNGHYVLVKPTGIPKPRLVLYSKDVAENLLILTEEQSNSEEFVNFVSGNLVLGETWATPYALSIMGNRYYNNCPYGTGDGYGDGRAISIAEFNGYELQLKGGGRTPFARGADGRAVLRSSIREFLASEAMHWLGVPTTRALSLVVSDEGGETVNRPWYSDDAVVQIPSMDDKRLAQYSDEQKREIIQRLRNQKADPNRMITEPCAITCRVASSFTRIGHLDLFSRRAEKKSIENAEQTDSRYDTSTLEWKELEDMVWHACYREFKEDAYDPFFDGKDIVSAATVLLDKSAEKLATMVAHWVRVGFAQGNFNADNCLVSGKTMDYGPFGFMEEYNPVFAKWTGSGEHFGFLNQPNAGYANYGVLVSSVVPVIAAATAEENPDVVGQPFLERAGELFQAKMDETFRAKLGFDKDWEVADELWGSLEPLLRSSRVDWTVFWRQLTYVMRDFTDLSSSDYEGMMATLEGEGDTSPFYEPLAPELREQWVEWMAAWRRELKATKVEGTEVYEHMRSTNPKYVLREWMLVDAYSAAGTGDESTLQELYELIQAPYEEGSEKQARNYYRRAPERALTAGGTAFMS
jgi:serine/tyrosine/threonine adenylyltransferase